MVVGILVMIEDASTVTILVVAVFGTTTSVYSGVVNVFACQSFKKKSIVLATAGSVTGRTIVVSVPPVGGSGSTLGVLLFLQESVSIAETPVERIRYFILNTVISLEGDLKIRPA